MFRTDGILAKPSSTFSDEGPIPDCPEQLARNQTLVMHAPVGGNVGTLPDFSDSERPDPLGRTVRLFAPVIVQPLQRACASGEDLGATRAFAVEELLARQRNVLNEIPGSSPSPSPSLLQRFECSFRSFVWRCWAGPNNAMSALQRDWQRLSAVQRRVLGALALGAASLCVCLGVGQGTNLPMAAHASPVQPVRAVVASAAAAQRAAPRPSASALLPPVGSKSTLERAAVDAYAEGRYVDALRIYEALGQAHPDQPAYREAERVLSRRITSQR